MDKAKLEHILHCHPIIKSDIARGKGNNLFSNDGKKVIDFEAGIWCTALGHSNSKINAVMMQQLEKIMHVHYKLTCEVADVLAVNLLDILDFKDGKATFLSSGSEAVELSMRISKLVSKGNKILTFSASYLSAYSSTSFPRDNSLWTQIDFSKCNNCCKNECTNKCSLLKDINFSDISTFILEPGNSGGRVLLPPYQLVRFLGDEVKKHGGLIVANEVTTGFGRTGEWFGFNHYDIKPDIVALGKCLGNGYPISGVVMRKEIANQVEMNNFSYAQSHQNDPLGCTVANEVIRIIKEDKLIDRSKYIGEFFLDQLSELKNSCRVIKDVRGRGLMLAIELNIKGFTELVCEMMLEKGFFIGTTSASDILRFYPSLTISKNDILSMCEALEHVLIQVDTLF